MKKRSYELFHVDFHTLSMLGAWKYTLPQAGEGKEERKGERSCSISYEQSLTLPLSQKGNTVLFEQLSEIIGLPYGVWKNVRADFLYDALFVNFRLQKEEDSICFLCAKAGAVLPMPAREGCEWLYTHGFSITGVPARGPDGARPRKAEAAEVEEVRYRAFVSSSSMSRDGAMLFVNERYFNELMERLTLGFFICDEGHRLRMPVERNAADPGRPWFQKNFRVSAAKMSAYLGLTLSDGVTLRERSQAMRDAGLGCPLADERALLNEETVFVAHDLNMKANAFYQNKGGYVWAIEAEQAGTPASLEDNTPEEAGRDAMLAAFFNKLTAPGTLDDALGDKALADRLNDWRAAAKAYARAPGKRLGWADPLPDACSETQTEHFAFLWGCALARRMKRTGEEELLDAVNRCIGLLDQPGVARNTLRRLVNHRGSLQLILKTGRDGADQDRQNVFSHCGRLMQAKLDRHAQTFRCRLKAVQELEREKINMFDGMGLCDPETFDTLEMLLTQKTSLPEDGSRRHSALVIRLPWMKGVLVRCDFHSFFREQAGNGPLPDDVTDVFGVRRRRDKIRVIVNESILKGCKYLANLRWDRQPDGAPKDPWKHYWDQVHAYGISLLIAGRDSLPGLRSPMNYQFLSTLNLTDKEMRDLAKENVERLAPWLSMDPEAARAFFSGLIRDGRADEAPDAQVGEAPGHQDGDDPPDGESQPEDAVSTVNTDVAFARALEKRPDLVGTRYARAAMQSHGRSALLDAMRGRLEVAGDYRFIAPDLMAMLRYLYDRYLSGDPFRADQYRLESPINFPRGEYRGHGCFFAPGPQTPWQRMDGSRTDIVALRNPHYAFGEEAVVSPLPESIWREYQRFFGQAFSLVMLPASAVATMGGADYDGDRANCVSQQEIVEAAVRAARQNQQALSLLLKNRERYETRFRAMAACGEQAVARFGGKLEAWLQKTFRAVGSGKLLWKKGYGIPLVFGDSHSTAVDFSCRETNMEAYLLDAFLLTAQQRIGMLSLEALEYASCAYRVSPAEETAAGKEGASGEKTAAGSEETVREGPLSAEDQRVLHDTVWSWRTVSLALENGAEIDMAKTGMKCKAAQLREATDLGRQNNARKAGFTDVTDLERLPASIMRTFDTRRKSSPARRLSGKEFSGELWNLLTRDKGRSEDDLLRQSALIARQPHNAVELVPALCYSEALRLLNKGGEAALQPPENGPDLLPLKSAWGASLRFGLLADKPSSRAGKQAKKEQKARHRQLEGKMERLVNAGDRQTREARLREYVADCCGLSPEQALALAEAPDEWVDGEQGIYFFKEALKFLYHTAQSAADEALLRNDAPKNPDELRRALLALATATATGTEDAETRLLRFLCTCDSVHSVSADRYVDNVNDYLFLSLAGDAFAARCGAEKKQELAPLAEGDPLLTEGSGLVAKYQAYKAHLAGHGEAHRRMLERYAYSLRNLQRRYGLAKALGIMGSYSRGFSESPAAQWGMDEARLKMLYTRLEDQKQEAEE